MSRARVRVDFAVRSFSDPAMRASLALSCLVAISGCGRSEPARSAEPEPEPSRIEPGPSPTETTRPPASAARRAPPGIEVEGEVGGLDPEAVDRAVASAGRDIDRCWEQGVGRNELVAGSIQLVLGVGGDGRAVYGFVKRSTLGEGEMERCMLKALSARAFPKPVGGKVGVVRTSLSFDLEKDTRAPNSWQSARVAEVLVSAAGEISACKHGATGTFTATVYVKQVELPPPDAGDGDAGEDVVDAGPTWVGAAVSVGIAAPDEQGWAAVECLSRVLKQAVYPAPGDWPAKVTFDL